MCENVYIYNYVKRHTDSVCRPCLLRSLCIIVNVNIFIWNFSYQDRLLCLKLCQGNTKNCMKINFDDLGPLYRYIIVCVCTLYI